jgi:hypothetical protein
VVGIVSGLTYVDLDPVDLAGERVRHRVVPAIWRVGRQSGSRFRTPEVLVQANREE